MALQGKLCEHVILYVLCAMCYATFLFIRQYCPSLLRQSSATLVRLPISVYLEITILNSFMSCHTRSVHLCSDIYILLHVWLILTQLPCRLYSTTLLRSSVFATATLLSVNLSVCPSVTTLDSVEMARRAKLKMVSYSMVEHIAKLLPPSIAPVAQAYVRLMWLIVPSIPDENSIHVCRYTL